MPYLLYVIEVRHANPRKERSFVGQFPLAADLQSMNAASPASLKEDLDQLCDEAMAMAMKADGVTAGDRLFARAIGAPTYIP